MLGKQLINLPFGVGVNQKVQAEILDPGQSLLEIQNLRINKTGSFQKRHGYDLLEPVPDETSALGILDGAPYAVGNNNLYSYSDELGFGLKSPVPPCTGTRRPVVNFSPQNIQFLRDERNGVDNGESYDIGYANGITVIATQSRVLAIGSNGSTIASYIPPVNPALPVPAPFLPRCVTVDDMIVVVFASRKLTGSTNPSSSIYRIYLDTNNLSLGFQGTSDPAIMSGEIYFPTSIVSGKVGFFDVCAITSTGFSPRYAVACANASGALHVDIHTFAVNSTSSIASTTKSYSGTFTAISVAISVFGDDDKVWLAVVGRNDIGGENTIGVERFNSITLATTETFNPNAMSNGVEGDALAVGILPTDDSNAILVASNPYSDTDTHAITRYVRLQATGGAIVPGDASNGMATTNIWRYDLAAKPFTYGDRHYVPLVSRVSRNELNDVIRNTENTFVLADITDIYNFDTNLSQVAVPVCTIAPRLIDIQLTPSCPRSTFVVGSKVITLASIKRSDVATSVELVTMDFAYPNQNQNNEYGSSSVLSTGVPSVFDGQIVSDIGYTQFPEYIAAFGTTVPGLLTPISGTFSYCAIYEWVTSSGEIVRSAPSAAGQVTLDGTIGNGMGRVQVPNLQLSSKFRSTGGSDLTFPQRLPKTIIYRTTDGGTVYYRLGDGSTGTRDPNPSDGPIISGSSENLTFHTGADVGVFDDLTPDNQLTSQEILYTQPNTPGTALPRLCPPSTTCTVVHRNRVWLVGDDGITVWYSGQFVDGEQPWFQDQFTFQVPKGGPITALASMDGILYIFKRDYIFSVTGDGPADNGSGNDLSTPEEMDVECGCIEPRSIVVAPGGIFYQSAQGLYMLGRSRSVAYVGQNVEDLLRVHKVIHSACLVDKVGCIYWEATPDENSTNNGVTIVYDYVHNQWMSDTKTIGESNTPAPGQSAIVIDGRYYWVTPGGVFNRESDGYFDAGKWVTAELTTAWAKLAGLQGYQRIWQINLNIARGDAVDDPTQGSFGLYAGLLRDYDSVDTFQDFTWTSDEIDALTTAVPQLQLNPKIQKLESIQMLFRDLPPVSGIDTGLGPVWVGLALEVGIKQGAVKLPAANSK